MVRLLMGVVIEAPEAKVSQDDMPQFLIEQAMRMNVFENGGEPPFCSNEYDDGTFAPIARPPLMKEKQKDPVKRAQPWNDLRRAWDATPTPKAAVGLWEKISGWVPGSLSPDKPKDLIENINTLFLSAPMLGAI